MFQGEDVRQTSHWFQAIQHYCLALGQWRRRRNGLANIMINGMVRTHHQETQSTMVRSHSMETTSMMRNSSHHLNVAETISLSASVSTITEMSSSNSPFLTSWWSFKWRISVAGKICKFSAFIKWKQNKFIVKIL